MRIILNHSSMVPIYEQLMEQIKSEIFENKLKENDAPQDADIRLRSVHRIPRC